MCRTSVQSAQARPPMPGLLVHAGRCARVARQTAKESRQARAAAASSTATVGLAGRGGAGAGMVRYRYTCIGVSLNAGKVRCTRPSVPSNESAAWTSGEAATGSKCFH